MGGDLFVVVVGRSTRFFIRLLVSKQPKNHLKPLERTNRPSCHEINGAIASGHVLDFASLCTWVLSTMVLPNFTKNHHLSYPPKRFFVLTFGEKTDCQHVIISKTVGSVLVACFLGVPQLAQES